MKSYKQLLNFFVILLLASCVDSGGEKKGAAPGATVSSSSVFIGTIAPKMAIKNFNQYNMTLSKVTGIPISSPAISSEYEKIKNSLPANHRPTSFTSFHQISATRLSFAYCNEFIDRDQEGSYASSAPIDSITNRLMGQFFGSSFDLNDPAMAEIRVQIRGILQNKISESSSDKFIVSNISANERMINLSKISCTALLSSAHFTVL